MIKNSIPYSIANMAYTAQLRLIHKDVEKGWMRRLKGEQIKVLEKKLCIGAATTKEKLHKPSCRSSPHLKLLCQVTVYTLQLLPPFLATRGLSQLFSTSHPESLASTCSSCQIIQMGPKSL